jgi:hypothetical protein
MWAWVMGKEGGNMRPYWLLPQRYPYRGVLSHEKLWYLFYRYLHVSPGTMQKCMLHNSVRYRNTHSRDPITLLSMDIVVETFLEIGVSDLLVST